MIRGEGVGGGGGYCDDLAEDYEDDQLGEISRALWSRAGPVLCVKPMMVGNF